MRKLLFFVVISQLLISVSCNNKKEPFLLGKNDFKSIAIILPDSANSIDLFAADELKHHLKLIFDENIQIAALSGANKFNKHIFIGITPKGFSKKLKPEESVYMIDGNSIYIFGEDAILRKYTDENPGNLGNKVLSEVLNADYCRTGTLHALYNFLENELGVRWIKQGDEGIFFTKNQSVSLAPKEFVWQPPLIQRNIRTGSFTYNGQMRDSRFAPKEFIKTEDEALKMQVDVLTWMRRMKMGKRENYRFGHAYNEYWNKYKDSNPGIFALNGKGERKPLARIERVKMCASNSQLPKLIVNEWRAYKDNPSNLPVKSISGCENDGDGYGDSEFCHCDSCMALGVLKKGDKFGSFLADRYVYLWNAILKEARKYQSDIMVAGYAYEPTLQPPVKQKLEDGIVIEFVPRMGGDYAKTELLYKGWENAGMKMMMFRPNDLNWETGIPLGQAERDFENYKLAIKHGAVGTDFDSMHGFGEGVTDETYYVITKGNADPAATFQELENDFLSVFGDAKDDIAKFYAHWRNKFNNKILPEELKLNDGVDSYFFEWHRIYRLTNRINDFYSIDDFDKTDSYLSDALKKNISEPARKYIERMQLVNEHSRLTFLSFLAGISKNKPEIIKNAKTLIDFRIKNKDKVDINWNVLFEYQHYQMNDLIGTKYLGYLPKELNR
jgi:hypothetical protein